MLDLGLDDLARWERRLRERAVRRHVQRTDDWLVGLLRWSAEAAGDPAPPPGEGGRGLASRLRGWGAGSVQLIGRVAERWRTQVEKVCPTGLVMLPPYTIPPFVIQIGERRAVEGQELPEQRAPPPPVGVLYCGFSLEDIKKLFAATAQVYLGLSEMVFSAANMEITWQEIEDFRGNKTDGATAGTAGDAAADPYAFNPDNPYSSGTIPGTPADMDYGSDYGDYS